MLLNSAVARTPAPVLCPLAAAALCGPTCACVLPQAPRRCLGTCSTCCSPTCRWAASGAHPAVRACPPPISLHTVSAARTSHAHCTVEETLPQCIQWLGVGPYALYLRKGVGLTGTRTSKSGRRRACAWICGPTCDGESGPRKERERSLSGLCRVGSNKQLGRPTPVR